MQVLIVCIEYLADCKNTEYFKHLNSTETSIYKEDLSL